jgi:hypothetical protein
MNVQAADKPWARYDVMTNFGDWSEEEFKKVLTN